MRLRRCLIVALLPIAGSLCAALAGVSVARTCVGGASDDEIMSRRPVHQGAVMLVADAGAAAPSTSDRAAAAEIFSSRCAACHGADGRGNGPASGSLKPRPVNFHNAKWQKATSDETIAKAIVEGGAAVGLSNQMMPNPDLEDEAGTVTALVARIRAFGK